MPDFVLAERYLHRPGLLGAVAGAAAIYPRFNPWHAGQVVIGSNRISAIWGTASRGIWIWRFMYIGGLCDEINRFISSTISQAVHLMEPSQDSPAGNG